MVTFQIVSDLHIEYNNDEFVDPLDFITPTADVLILAGDIGSLYKFVQLQEFIKNIIKCFKHVFYIPGNHEYYISPDYKQIPLEVLSKRLNDLNNMFDNFNVLDKECAQINNICIVGATLWSDIKCQVPKYIVRIPEMTTDNYIKKFNEDLEYIKNAIEYCNKNKLTMLCVTHHPPTQLVFKEGHLSKKKDKFKSLYYSDLDYLLTKDMVHTWICGHVHSNFDCVSEGGTRIVGNQKGKPKDNIRDFSKEFVIEL